MQRPFDLPDNVTLESMAKDSVGEHNQCFHCQGTVEGKPSEFFVKIYRSPEINLPIERAILPRLREGGIPVPRVLFARGDYLALSAIKGDILQEFIDPRRGLYQAQRNLHFLGQYGAMLGRVHAMPIATTPLTRRGLYDLSDEERDYLKPHPDLPEWLARHSPQERVDVLAHGDLHTAQLFFEEGEVSGVIDWESAGMGWREFDLAWILRARQAFLNTPEERAAILEGYARHGAWDEAALRWCEVLMYLHYAFWTRGTGTGYEAFALGRARSITVPYG